MSKPLSRRKEGWYILGVLLLTSAVLFNPWTLTKLFSPDGKLQPETQAMVCFLQLTLVLLGSTLILLRPLVNSGVSSRRMFQMYPRRSAAVVGGFMMLFTVGSLEAFFYVMNAHHRKGMEIVMMKAQGQSAGSVALDGAHILDDALGYKVLPATHIHSIAKIGKQVVYDVNYTTDEFSRRITPWSSRGPVDKFALFFGCSFMFGQGVMDNETLPYYVGELTSRYRPYNYGGIGYGPQQMLAKFQERTLPREVSERQGVLIYLLIGDHVNRAIGSVQVHNDRGIGMPFYTVDSDGMLVRRGNFKSDRPMLDLFYGAMGISQTTQYFGINFPRTNDSHLYLTTRILSKSRNLFRDTFHSDEFYVVLFPGEALAVRIKPFLEDAGIKCLDYTSLIDLNGEGFRIPGDPHPTPRVYQTLASRISEDTGIIDKIGEGKR